MLKVSEEYFATLFPFASKGSHDLAKELLSLMQPFTCSVGTTLYFDGDNCSQIAFLISGEIRVYKIGETGREITLYEIGPGETCILNASCILSNSHYPANATTLSECAMLMLPAKEFKTLVDRNEPVREFVFGLLSQRLSVVMSLVEEVAFARLDIRLFDYLIAKSDNHILHMTHQEIANNLGSSREVISRLLKDFEKRGRVQLSRNCIKLLVY